MLKNLAKITGEIELRGETVPIYPLTLGDCRSLLVRFPKIGTILSGNVKEPADLLVLGIEVVTAIATVALGSPKDDEELAAIDELTLDELMDVIGKMVEITMPSGFGPFVVRLQKAGLLAAVPSVA